MEITGDCFTVSFSRNPYTAIFKYPLTLRMDDLLKIRTKLKWVTNEDGTNQQKLYATIEERVNVKDLTKKVKWFDKVFPLMMNRERMKTTSFNEREIYSLSELIAQKINQMNAGDKDAKDIMINAVQLHSIKESLPLEKPFRVDKQGLYSESIKTATKKGVKRIKRLYDRSEPFREAYSGFTHILEGGTQSMAEHGLSTTILSIFYLLHYNEELAEILAQVLYNGAIFIGIDYDSVAHFFVFGEYEEFFMGVPFTRVVDKEGRMWSWLRLEDEQHMGPQTVKI